ncbi:hypothetical protein PHYPSEUDO_012102 [Phytophthora pseudosyringae]|uniref:Transmembrane protein n=1 Tax=Phytophthora pseudosyringae TaxID=221518 RepID=A0A8T1W5M7_9STRA|nr:hypothetical protein PHYPSEUDO_012102 [Phytophthora pseudosyringae]
MPFDLQAEEELEAARYQRFCAFAEQLVPNKNMWSTVYRPPTTFFSADELPFEEKKLFCWEIWNSLMFSCIASMATLLASMFTLYTLHLHRKQASGAHCLE